MIAFLRTILIVAELILLFFQIYKLFKRNYIQSLLYGLLTQVLCIFNLLLGCFK